MPKNIDKELEFAIVSMSVKDKDKLMLRLIAKNDILIEQLRFQLLEDNSDLNSKRQEIKDQILKVSKMTHSTPGWMMMDMRDINGSISKHVKITKDKYGEIELTLALLKNFIENNPEFFLVLDRRNDTLSEYVAKRTEFLMKKLKAIHEEYYIEFEADVQFVLEEISTGSAARYAKELNLPKTWDY
jgi:hypothetical protein